jgi:hypothetical protein
VPAPHTKRKCTWRSCSHSRTRQLKIVEARVLYHLPLVHTQPMAHIEIWLLHPAFQSPLCADLAAHSLTDSRLSVPWRMSPSSLSLNRLTLRMICAPTRANRRQHQRQALHRQYGSHVQKRSQNACVVAACWGYNSAHLCYMFDTSRSLERQSSLVKPA